MKTRQWMVWSIMATLLAGNLCLASEAYTSDWESLRKHPPVPEWLLDAKFGIYAHWGVFSVPEYGNEWYPSYMFDKDGVRNKMKIYEYHAATYGDLSKFGYHDFVPMFKGEKFNADSWAELYKKAGARFGGAVTEHHDGFSMWASKVNPWNAGEMGPRRDVIGELEKSIRSRGMKFITTFHHARMYGKRQNREYWSKAPGWPTTSDDPRLRILYGNIPFVEGIKLWRRKLDEVVADYRPDLVWFDVDLELVPEQAKRDFLTHYFNAAQDWGREVLVTYKHKDLPPGIGLLDYENTRADTLTPEPWMTDDTIGVVGSCWSYARGMKYKAAEKILSSLLDIISKNGVLLLNISPRANGSIPEEQKEILLTLGQWLARYGECVYNTRPWVIYGEGKNPKPDARKDFPANENEIRYTRRGNTVYASLLQRSPSGKELILKGFSKKRVRNEWRVTAVTLLGSNAEIAWKQAEAGLIITLPSTFPASMINVFKIECH